MSTSSRGSNPTGARNKLDGSKGSGSQKLGQYARENLTYAPKAINHGGDQGGGQGAGVHSSLSRKPDLMR